MWVAHWAQGGWETPLTPTAGQGTSLPLPPSALCPQDRPSPRLPHACPLQSGSELVLEVLGGAEPQGGDVGVSGALQGRAACRGGSRLLRLTACLITLGCAQLQGTCWREISGVLSNRSGSAQGSLEEGRHHCWRSSLPPSHTASQAWPYHVGRSSGHCRLSTVAGAPGPSPLLPACLPHPQALRAQRGWGTGPSVFSFLFRLFRSAG